MCLWCEMAKTCLRLELIMRGQLSRPDLLTEIHVYFPIFLSHNFKRSHIKILQSPIWNQNKNCSRELCIATVWWGKSKCKILVSMILKLKAHLKQRWWNSSEWQMTHIVVKVKRISQHRRRKNVWLEISNWACCLKYCSL